VSLSPLCLTADLDWTSEYAIQGFLDLTREFGITPTVFATHRSAALERAQAAGAAEIGLHPNFLPGSTHGHDVESVVEHVCALYPEARSYRAHGFRDDTHISDAMVRRGFTHDSNLCLFLQPNLRPLWHHAGTMRFPVFWEDDVHYRNTGGDWNLDRWLPEFLSPGLKVLNVHPFMLAANVPNGGYYGSVKRHIPTLGAGDIEVVRHPGHGVQTFLRALLEALTEKGLRFSTLGELHRAAASRPRVATVGGVVEGRQAMHAAGDVERYASMTDGEKQAFVRREFEDRNPVDPYATSRDYNMRELEIQAIARELTQPGPVLDLGCGNGYTLISVASRLPGWTLTGVDFSKSLIDGAHLLAAQRAASMTSAVEFVHADALEYLPNVATGSQQYVITERFLQNLPSRQSQLQTIREIHRVLAPNGRLLMCEGSETGFEQLNDLRAAVGLSRIPSTSRENVSAIRFDDCDVEQALAEIGFTLVQKVGFSLYFIIARVLHPLLVAPDSPRFDAPINDLAGLIQAHTQAAPGYGGSMLWVCQK
jgi:ubiquinone/menaquinone biosynthesis C-methylase UbiE